MYWHTPGQIIENPLYHIRDEELDQLLQDTQLEEPDSDGGNGNSNNNASIVNPFQVLLYSLLSGHSQMNHLAEPALSSTQPKKNNFTTALCAVSPAMPA